MQTGASLTPIVRWNPFGKRYPRHLLTPGSATNKSIGWYCFSVYIFIDHGIIIFDFRLFWSRNPHLTPFSWNIMLLSPEISVPLLIGYAEIHFRFFPHFPSLLFKKEPEILFDLPARLDPGCDLPVLLILHDLVRFPVTVGTVAITVTKPRFGTKVFNFNTLENYEVIQPYQKQQRAFIFSIPRSEIDSGEVFVNATVTITSGIKKVTIFNDNIPSSSRRAFRCFIANDQIPGKNLCSYGDLHMHSYHSQSHVEFGPPLAVIDCMAVHSGLQFVGITDHSYDLSCQMDNYLIEDEDITHWKILSQELQKSPAFQTIILQGEEVSCLNSSGETVHLLGLGLTRFLPGSRDGARKTVKKNRHLTIQEAVTDIKEQGGCAVAAHPGARSGLAQKLLLHRGTWLQNDCTAQLDGFQALNAGFGKSWKTAKNLWLNMLQSGIKVPLLGGNDAHGDFNRYRAIGKPFLSIYENFQRYMGYGKTGIYGQCTTAEQVLTKIRQGATFVTTGPYISINYTEEAHSHAIASSPVTTPGSNLFVHAISTPEFGAIKQIAVFAGLRNSTAEEIDLLVIHLDKMRYDVMQAFSITACTVDSYLRAEITTIRDDESGEEAYTSCCFFS